MTKPKVLWIYTINPGVTFYRMYQFAKKMDELDLVVSRLYPEWEPRKLTSPTWESTLNKDYGFWEEMVEWADLVICQYVAQPEGVALTASINQFKPCFMETDDAFGAVPGYSMAYDANRPGDSQQYWATRQMMESRGLITSTEYLKNMYDKYAKKCVVMPNCINFDVWKPISRERKQRLRIGWIGGATHSGDLKLIKEVLYDVLDKYENVEVVICSSPPPDWEKTDRLIMFNKWVTIDQYPDHLMDLKFDIGLAPLRDNYFNRGKSNLRFLEYAAMGIPTIASDVEPFRKTSSAILCSTSRDWMDSLCSLIEDEKLRYEKGDEDYQYVLDNYNLTYIAKKYAEFIKGNL